MDNSLMNDTEFMNKPITRWDHEQAMMRSLRVHERDFNLILILIALLFITNGLWIWHESQYQDVVTETYTAETDSGGTAIANGKGTVTVNGNESDLYKDNNQNP